MHHRVQSVVQLKLILFVSKRLFTSKELRCNPVESLGMCYKPCFRNVSLFVSTYSLTGRRDGHEVERCVAA